MPIASAMNNPQTIARRRRCQSPGTRRTPPAPRNECRCLLDHRRLFNQLLHGCGAPLAGNAKRIPDTGYFCHVLSSAQQSRVDQNNIAHTRLDTLRAVAFHLVP